MTPKIGLQIIRRAVYTDGQPCQLVLTELGADKLIVSFHDDTGTEDVIGTQRHCFTTPSRTRS